MRHFSFVCPDASRRLFFVWAMAILVAIVASTSHLQAQTAWTQYGSGPVLDVGPAGSWEDGTVLNPCVLQDQDTLKMWYTGVDNTADVGNSYIGYAWSTDGISWTRYSGNPVLPKSASGFDNGHTGCGGVIRDGDTLRMWYGATPSGIPLIPGPDQKAGYATSTDGIHWNRLSTPVLQPGAQGEWDHDIFMPGNVIKDGSLYKMWYSGGTGQFFVNGAHTISIGYATSPDGIHWMKYDDPATTTGQYQSSDPVLQQGTSPERDCQRAYTPWVRKTDSGYEMWYAGGTTDRQAIMYATSPDGITWTKTPEWVFLGAGWANSASMVIWPCVIVKGNQYCMWFSGFVAGTAARIGYATAPVPPEAKVFDTKVDYLVGLSPYGLVAADFDNDGDIDLATGVTVGQGDGRGWVSVLRNNGLGTFTVTDTVVVGDDLSLAAADLNGNGSVDLTVADASTNRVYILLNSGQGKFVVADNFASGGVSARGHCAADLDGDGDIDLAVPNFSSGNLAIFKNNGDASFEPPVIHSVGSGPHTAIAGDVDKDGDLDLLVSNCLSGTVSVLLNTGNGAFSSRVDYGVGTNPQRLSLADFDNDGILDLAVPNAGGSYLSVLKGKGDGTFQAKVDWPGGHPISAVPADFDLDGNIDIAVANFGNNNVSLFRGKGDLTFHPHETFPTGNGPIWTVAADFDKDGDIDLAVAGAGGNTVSVHNNFIVETDVAEPSGVMPDHIALEQNYPNPFNPKTGIRFEVLGVSNVKIAVYDLLGREVAVLVNEKKAPGNYEVSFDGSGLSSGVYFYRLTAGQFVETRKMILMK